MKIVSLQAENFKRLKAVEIKPDGSTVVITGRNAQGKSSILDSIFAAVGGAEALPSKPIRKGEQTARIKLDLGELVITRKFTAAGSTLTVEGANGARFGSPQRMMDDLVGVIAFDPLEFTRMKAEKQFETVRSLVKLDVDIDVLDGQNAKDFEARTDVNREVKSLRAQAAGIPVASGLPAQPIDTAALLTQMQEAGEANSQLEQRKLRREQTCQDIARHTKVAAERRAEAAEFRERATELDELAGGNDMVAADLQKKLDDAPALPDPANVSDIRAQIEAADLTNAKIADRQRRLQIETSAAEKEALAQKLTDAMEARKTAKDTAIRSAKMPVEGLTFGDKEILYNDLPLDQASQAERIRISMAVAMALNPKLRVLTIKDGSLIDDEGLAVIQQMIADGDYQLWLERVGSDGKLGILIEDGSVVEPATEQGAMPLDAA